MMCALPDKIPLKRLDPRTGEELATITLVDFPTNTPEVAVGAGSVWVTSGSGEAGVVIRVDPRLTGSWTAYPWAPPPAWPSGTVRCG